MKGINQELDQADALATRVAELEAENLILRRRQSLREASAKGGRSRSAAKLAAARANAVKGGRPSLGRGFDWAAKQAKEESRVARVGGLWRAEYSVPVVGTGELQWWPVKDSKGSWGHANDAKRAWRAKRAAELRAAKATQQKTGEVSP